MKMLYQVFGIVKHVLENIMKDQICTHSMQFGFMKEKETTDTIIIMWQLHK